MRLDNLAPVGGRATSGCNRWRLERLAEVCQDLPDRARTDTGYPSSDPRSYYNRGDPQSGSGWNYSLFPYIEQQALYDRLPPGAATQYWRSWWSAEANDTNGPTRVSLPVWLCPSDNGRYRFNIQGWGVFSLGNYIAIFGGLNLGGAVANLPDQRAAFGVNFGARISDVIDGTSNTMILSEYLRGRGASNDQRGMVWGDQPGYGQVYTQLSPNTSSPDILYVGWCDNQPASNLPCISGDVGPNNTAAARSNHLGGVNVAFADGSVRFVQQKVDLLKVWRPLATIAGGESAPSF